MYVAYDHHQEFYLFTDPGVVKPKYCPKAKQTNLNSPTQ